MDLMKAHTTHTPRAASYPWNSQWPSYGTLRDLVQLPYFTNDVFNNSALPFTVRHPRCGPRGVTACPCPHVCVCVRAPVQTYVLVSYRVNSPHGDDNYWVVGITPDDVQAEIQARGQHDVASHHR